MKDHDASLLIGHRYPEAVGIVTWDFLTFASLKREGSMFGTNPSMKEIRAKSALFHFFSRVLEIAQQNFTRRDATADGTVRTLSRIDRAFINLPMAKARDFHCFSSVLENLGKTVHTK